MYRNLTASDMLVMLPLTSVVEDRWVLFYTLDSPGKPRREDLIGGWRSVEQPWLLDRVRGGVLFGSVGKSILAQ